MPTVPPRIFTANDELIDRAVRHQIYLERLKTGMVRRLMGPFQADLDELIAETRKEVARLRRISADMQFKGQRGSVILDRMVKKQRSILRAAYKRMKRRGTSEWVKLASTEAEFARASIRAAMPISVDFALPTHGYLKAVVSKDPMHGKIIAQHFDDLNQSARAAIRQATQLGLARGDSIEKIVESIEGTKRAGFKDGVFQGMRNKLNTTVRTISTSVSAKAREASYEESTVVKAVQWVSTLDTSTTIICAGLDGKTDPGELGGERPPAHYNCRSTTAPVLKSWKELGINLRDAPPGTRAQMPGSKGSATEKTTYGQWLKRQSKEMQNDVLGKERAALFRAGKVKIDRFVDYSKAPPRLFSIKDLRKREGLKVSKARTTKKVKKKATTKKKARTTRKATTTKKATTKKATTKKKATTTKKVKKATTKKVKKATTKKVGKKATQRRVSRPSELEVAKPAPPKAVRKYYHQLPDGTWVTNKSLKLYTPRPRGRKTTTTTTTTPTTKLAPPKAVRKYYHQLPDGTWVTNKSLKAYTPRGIKGATTAKPKPKPKPKPVKIEWALKSSRNTAQGYRYDMPLEVVQDGEFIVLREIDTHALRARAALPGGVLSSEAEIAAARSAMQQFSKKHGLNLPGFLKPPDPIAFYATPSSILETELKGKVNDIIARHLAPVTDQAGFTLPGMVNAGELAIVDMAKDLSKLVKAELGVNFVKGTAKGTAMHVLATVGPKKMRGLIHSMIETRYRHGVKLPKRIELSITNANYIGRYGNDMTSIEVNLRYRGWEKGVHQVDNPTQMAQDASGFKSSGGAAHTVVHETGHMNHHRWTATENDLRWNTPGGRTRAKRKIHGLGPVEESGKYKKLLGKYRNNHALMQELADELVAEANPPGIPKATTATMQGARGARLKFAEGLISEYGMTDPLEFVAEIYAKALITRWRPKGVMLKWYKRFGGAPLD